MAIRNPFRNNKIKETDDLGFGNRITGERDRLIFLVLSSIAF